MRALLFFAAVALYAQDSPSLKPLAWSGVSLEASAAVDAMSSRGLYELNPVLGRGQFGAKQSAKLIGVTGAVALLEIPLARRFPRLRKYLELGNYVGAGLHGAAAIHNWRLSR
jgi:hypothetical protein